MPRIARSKSKLAGNLVILVILLLSLFGTTQPTSAQVQPSVVPNLDVVLVIDESGSMWGESDPPNSSNQGWRIVMAKLFADLLGVDQSGSTHALSVIVFGAQAETVRGLTPVQDNASREDLKAAIDLAHVQTQNMFYLTNIPDALTQAYTELDTHGRPGSEKAVIFLSDGKCDLENTIDKAACNQNIRQIIGDHFVGKYPVYTIAFTDKASVGGDSAIYENLWQEIAVDTDGEYFKPNKAEGDLLDVYIQILRHLFNLSSESIPNPSQSPSKQLFNIPEDQLQAVFTIVKYNENIKTTIIRPDGSIVEESDPDVRTSFSPQTDSYGFIQPEAGPWYVQMEGAGEVTVVFIPFPSYSLKVDRLSPLGLTHPMGKPMDITIQIVDSSGDLQSTTDDLNVDVTLPDETTQMLTFTKVDDTTYSARLQDTSQLGRYQLHFYGGQDENKVDDLQNIDVIRAPWILVLEPGSEVAYPIQEPLTIRAQLMYGKDPVTIPDPSDTVTVTAQLLDSNNNSIDLQQLKLEAGIFSRQMNFDTPGSYNLEAKVVLTKPSGEEYQDVSLVKISAEIFNEPTPTDVTATPMSSLPPPPAVPPKPFPIGLVLGGLGGLILAGVLGGLGWWWFNRPSLIGTLDSGGMEASFPLSGRKPVFMGSDDTCQFKIYGNDILPKHAELRPIGNRKNPQVEIRSVDSSKLVRVDKIETIFQTLRNGNVIKIGSFEYTYSGPPTLEDFETDNSMTTPSAKTNEEDGWKF
jgi:hypothetical protein